MSDAAFNYATYLELDRLLSLQDAASAEEHDEHLFIVVHQVYELWFKQILHEARYLTASLRAGEAARAEATFNRILTILKTLVAQVDVLETMTPVQFSSFRSRLKTASGFQSFQFRCLEVTLGRRDPALVRHFGHDPAAVATLERLHAEPSLYDAFLACLARGGVPIPDDVLARDPGGPIPEDERVRAALVDLYRAQAPLHAIAERMVDLDEGLQEWRYRHVKMVERTIGRKMGTGGSAGAEYLRSTLFRPFFPDLWAIRSEL
ncbi:MAG: tryptophan 2,3-dioxygenase [Myxococcales bacterium]|nr:tryptophan 2,3-dioxygenase [Myxococcales bacterium]MCB9737619.1 tryptophan 2,3-dioxygenase [Deltaproteobacteria bacterium]